MEIINNLGFNDLLLLSINILLTLLLLKVNELIKELRCISLFVSFFNIKFPEKIEEFTETQSEAVVECLDKLGSIEQDISDVKEVMDVFYKYKLPSKREREILDEIEINEEVLDGIRNAKSKRKPNNKQ